MCCLCNKNVGIYQFNLNRFMVNILKTAPCTRYFTGEEKRKKGTWCWLQVSNYIHLFRIREFHFLTVSKLVNFNISGFSRLIDPFLIEKWLEAFLLQRPSRALKNLFVTIGPTSPWDLQHQSLAVILRKQTLMSCISPLLLN